MVAILTTVLMTAAEISNLFSAIGVVICFVCMVIFILRIQGEDVFGTSVVHVAQPPLAQVAYQKVAVPFSVGLHKAQDASFKDVQLKVRSEVNYALRSFWGVPSDRLHMLLAAPWTGFFLHLIEEPSVGAQVVDEVLRSITIAVFCSFTFCNLQKTSTEHNLALCQTSPILLSIAQLINSKQTRLAGSCLSAINVSVFDNNGQILLLISLAITSPLHEPREDVTEAVESVKKLSLSPEAPSLSLGPMPRRTYPLVVCVVRQDTSHESDDSKVGALITIIHIKDGYCQVPTCILHQYLKQYSGQLTKLETLFTQGSASNPANTRQNTEPEEGHAEHDGDEEEVPLEEACVVCQIKRTTRALLPCRHVCLCDECCTRLDNCPMCRARILAYFLVAAEAPAGQREAQQQEGSERDTLEQSSTWQRFNNAVNRMMAIDNHR